MTSCADDQAFQTARHTDTQSDYSNLTIAHMCSEVNNLFDIKIQYHYTLTVQ